MNSVPFREVRDIPRLRNPGVESLQRDHFDPGLPCVIEGVHAQAELDSWMREFETNPTVVPCVVARSLNIAKISDSDRPPVARAPELPDVSEFTVDLPFAEAWARMNRPRDFTPLLCEGECVYVIEGRVPRDHPFPGRAPETPLEERLYSDPRTPLAIVNMPGMINRNHTHVHEVLLHQVFHRKQVRLFSPADTQRLAMNADRRSEIQDFDRVDLAKYPGVADCVAHQAVLEPGDVLFLPSYWWHEIRVAEPAVSVGFTIEAGVWARRAFQLHDAVADALEAYASGPDAGDAASAGVAAIVLSISATLLDQAGLASTISALRYEYDD